MFGTSTIIDAEERPFDSIPVEKLKATCDVRSESNRGCIYGVKKRLQCYRQGRYEEKHLHCSLIY